MVDDYPSLIQYPWKARQVTDFGSLSVVKNVWEADEKYMSLPTQQNQQVKFSLRAGLTGLLQVAEFPAAVQLDWVRVCAD